MPLISNVGNNSFSQKWLKLVIYGLLILGACGIIYPLMVVFGQTLSDRYDLHDNSVVPHYLTDRNELLLKHVFNQCPASVSLAASRHNRSRWSSQAQMRGDRTYFEECKKTLEKQGFSINAWQNVAADLDEFKETVNPDELLVNIFGLEDYYRPFLKKTYAALADKLIKDTKEGKPEPQWLRNSFPDKKQRNDVLTDYKQLTIAVMNHELEGNYLNFHSVELLPEKNYLVPFWRPGSSTKEKMWRSFKHSLPPQQLLIIPADAYWHAFLKARYRVVKNLNETWSTAYSGFYEIHTPAHGQGPAAEQTDLEYFLAKRWPRRLLRVNGDYTKAWQTYVMAKIQAKIGKKGEHINNNAIAETASKLAGIHIASIDKLAFPRELPENSTYGLYWSEFTSSGIVKVCDLDPRTPEKEFRNYLLAKYGSGNNKAEALAKINRAWQANFHSFDTLPLPLVFRDFVEANIHANALRWNFATESFRRVLSYLFGQGRAGWNTLVLVVLSLISALTLNPLAAYSLSRFPMKKTHKVLLFFLATMAFPAEVAMIPNFLLLRDLGMLNTYAALILPGMANGFAIFLLKGFFDSLPQELFQAAELDGASELQIFRMVAMPLITPILAYIGLGTFMSVYGSFMWALVICPDPKMWTLMVWVYDFQMNNSGNNYIMAATVLVSIPPLIVFLFANKIIMKGIIIPSMK